MEVGTYSIATLVGGANPPSHGSDRPQSTPCSVARQQAASPGFSTQSNKRCDPVRLRKRFCNCVATAARYASVPSWAVLVRAARKASAPAGSGSGCSGPCLKWVKFGSPDAQLGSPLYPQEQTSSAGPMRSGKCQQTTWDCIGSKAAQLNCRNIPSSHALSVLRNPRISERCLDAVANFY